MKNGINMKNRDIIGIMSLLLILSLVIGCIGSDKKNTTTEPTIVPTTTTEKIIEPTTTTEKSVEEETVVKETAGAVEETVVPITEDRIDESIFKVNDEKIMLDRSIRLIDLATEEGVAIIKVSGDSYKLTDNIEQEIKGRRIKITDLDGVNQTVKIIVRYIT